LKLYINAPNISLDSTNIGSSNALKIFNLMCQTPMLSNYETFKTQSATFNRAILTEIESVKSKIDGLQQNYITLYDNEQRLNSLKITNEHVLNKKLEIEQDNQEMEAVLKE
jgi:hypothetical protein